MTIERDANPLEALRRSASDDHRLDPGAADRIEARLRIAHAESAAATSPQRWRPVVAASLALVLAVAVSIAIVVRGSEPAAALVVTDAANVTVRLPDGSSVVDPADGYILPDGAVVEIGAGGMVTVDDIVLDTAGVLEVRDGRLVSDIVATTTTPARPDHLTPDPPTTEAPTDIATTTTAAPTTTAATTAPPTTAAPDAPDTTRPAEPDEPPSTTTSGRPERDDRADRDGRRDDARDDDGRDATAEPPDPDGGPATDDPPNDDPRDPADEPITVTIALDLEPAQPGVRVTWLVEGLQPGWSVVILRTVGDGAAVVATTTEPSGEIVDQPTRGDERPADRRARYRVVVIDEAGGEVAAGPSQSLR